MNNQDLERTAIILAGKTVIDTPNDSELGEKVRKMLYERNVIEEINQEKKDSEIF